MHIRHISSRNRRGVSTILGTLIFIGIMFSAIIPMTLVMKQADNIYTRKIHEAENLNLQTAEENIIVYAYPDNSTNKLTIKIQNKGTVPVKLARIWVNNKLTENNQTIPISETVEIPGIHANLQEEVFTIKVTIENGNVFTSISGSIYYQFSTSTWVTPSLGICINVVNDVGRYDLSIKNSTGHVLDSYTSHGMDFGDLVKSFLVEDNLETYTVTIKKKSGGDWVDLPGTPVNILINWPNDSPIKYVFASGVDV